MADPSIEDVLARLEAAERKLARLTGPVYGVEAWRAFGTGRTKYDGLGIQFATGDPANLPSITFAERLFGNQEDISQKTYGRIYGDPAQSELVFVHHTAASTKTMTLGVAGLALDAALALVQTTEDQAEPADGWILYRSDTDQFRGYRNGSWLNFLMAGDVTEYTPPDHSEEWGLFDDFLSNTPGSIFTQLVSGANAEIQEDETYVDGSHPGIWRLETGTESTGFASLHNILSGRGKFALGGGETRFRAWVLLPVLSDGTNGYTVLVGFTTGPASVNPDGVQFIYSDSVNSGKWQLRTEDSSTTTADSGVAVAADTWYELEAVVNAAGTSAQFFINGTSVGTINADIPTAPLGMNIFFTKSAGTASRELHVDYAGFFGVLTTPR